MISEKAPTGIRVWNNNYGQGILRKIDENKDAHVYFVRYGATCIMSRKDLIEIVDEP